MAPEWDLRLFRHALRLALRAQGVRGRPFDEVLQSALALPMLPERVGPARARRATLRACSRLGRWFGLLDTCLVRGLVLGTLLADQEGVVLHVGFRPGRDRGDDADGHAWVSLRGVVVSEDVPQAPAYTESLAIPLRRPTRYTRRP